MDPNKSQESLEAEQVTFVVSFEEKIRLRFYLPCFHCCRGCHMPEHISDICHAYNMPTFLSQMSDNLLFFNFKVIF